MRGHRAFLFTFSVMLASSILSGAGCSDGSNGAAPVCLDAGVDRECTPSYEPTWDALYANTFQRSCAASGISCHAATGRQGGVDFSNSDTAYANVQSKVRPGQPECSILVHRVLATDGKVRMPPGRSLPAGEQCAIVQWVANGARR
ncbi:MAG TPA: c-type cytochrome domain-containing protein [Labilithrix sp.]|nr:c-type cytochrome domain-containing protein [Labilithrix sp.]